MTEKFTKRLWLVYAILGAFSWGIWGIFTKYISSDISPFTTHFLFTTGMLFSLPFILRKCKIKEFSTKGIFLGIGAGIVAVIGNVSVYQSFKMGGQAAIVIPFTNLYPLITILIALLIFREKLHFINGLGLLIILPALIILSGQTRVFNEPALFFQNMGLKVWFLFAVLSMVLFGMFSALQKLTTKYISTEWSYLSFIASSVIVSICFIAFGLVDFNFSLKTFWIGTMAGGFDGLGVLFIYSAYRANGKASQVSSITAALQQVFTIVIAVIFLKEHLDYITSLGIVLAICGAYLLSLEKKKQ